MWQTHPQAQPTQSPLSSLGGSEGIMEDNQSLRLQVHWYEALLQEKSKLLCEKGKSLIACQSTTMKHILDLVVAPKDKLDQQMVLDEK